MTLALKLVSEREPGSAWEDCVWCTGVMLGNVMVGENRYPATRDEYEGLRFAATGVREAEGDGSNYRELARGMLARYKLIVRRGSGWAAAMDQIPIGSWGAFQGLYSKLPGRLRITTFTGGHSMAAERKSETAWDLYDPLALNGSAPRSISTSELRAYYEGLTGGEWIAAYEREAWRAPMIVFNVERFRVPKGTPVYENPNGVRVTVFSADAVVTSIGVPNDHSADGVDYSWRAILVTTGALDKISRTKIAFVKRPALSVPTAPEWDAAVAKALADPEFRGGEVIDATQAQITAAHKAGVLEGITLVDDSVEKLKLAQGG